jgi:hypothetical protein
MREKIDSKFILNEVTQNVFTLYFKDLDIQKQKQKGLYE